MCRLIIDIKPFGDDLIKLYAEIKDKMEELIGDAYIKDYRIIQPTTRILVPFEHVEEEKDEA